jgi:hypothetical protein
MSEQLVGAQRKNSWGSALVVFVAQRLLFTVQARGSRRSTLDRHALTARRPLFGKGLLMATKNRIFIAFAIEDANARTMLVGQARLEHSPFEFVDMSVKEPWDEKWKTLCRSKIRGCDGVIALLSKKTMPAEGARWEMKCATEEKIPMIGVHINKDAKGDVPLELLGKKVIEWSWPGIAAFIDSLP